MNELLLLKLIIHNKDFTEFSLQSKRLSKEDAVQKMVVVDLCNQNLPKKAFRL